MGRLSRADVVNLINEYSENSEATAIILASNDYYCVAYLCADESNASVTYARHGESKGIRITFIDGVRSVSLVKNVVQTRWVTEED